MRFRRRGSAHPNGRAVWQAGRCRQFRRRVLLSLSQRRGSCAYNKACAIGARDFYGLAGLCAAGCGVSCRLDPGGLVGPVQEAGDVAFPVDRFARSQTEQVKKMLVMMLVLHATEVIGPERHYFKEDVMAGPPN